MQLYDHRNPNGAVPTLDQDARPDGVRARDFPSIDRPDVVMAVRVKNDDWLQFFFCFRRKRHRLTMSLNGYEMQDEHRAGAPSDVEFIFPKTNSGHLLTPGSQLVISVDGYIAEYNVHGVKLWRGQPLSREQLKNANGRIP